MNNLEKILLYFSYDLKDMKILREILKEYEDKEPIYKSSDYILKEIYEKIMQSYNFDENVINLRVDSMINELNMNNIKYITFININYPYLLKQIFDFPIVLYYIGNINLLSVVNKISIVGSRKPSFDGKKMCHELAKYLRYSDYVIVSGLAYGIDALIHTNALINNIPTISVIPSGLKNIVPIGNLNLSKQIIDNNGLLLSEFWIEHKAFKWEYVYRNRIISGISKKVFIIEAGEKSGSLNTAHHAIDQNRELYAMPGSLSNPTARGTNNLIKNGAYCVTTASDLFENEILKTENAEIDPILDYIRENQKVIIDDLLKKFNISYTDLILKLTDFEINEEILINGDEILCY